MESPWVIRNAVYSYLTSFSPGSFFLMQYYSLRWLLRNPVWTLVVSEDGFGKMPAQYMNNLNILSLDYYPIISYHTLLSTLNYIGRWKFSFNWAHCSPDHTRILLWGKKCKIVIVKARWLPLRTDVYLLEMQDITELKIVT